MKASNFISSYQECFQRCKTVTQSVILLPEWHLIMKHLPHAIFSIWSFSPPQRFLVLQNKVNNNHYPTPRGPNGPQCGGERVLQSVLRLYNSWSLPREAYSMRVEPVPLIWNHCSRSLLLFSLTLEMKSWSSLYVFVIFMAVLLWPPMEYNKKDDVDPVVVPPVAWLFFLGSEFNFLEKYHFM